MEITCYPTVTVAKLVDGVVFLILLLVLIRLIVLLVVPRGVLLLRQWRRRECGLSSRTHPRCRCC